MNKILKVFKRLLCVSSSTDGEMANLSQLSPRVTRSKSKKQEKVEAECQQKKADDKLRKNSQKVGGSKGKRKKRKSSEVNSTRAIRGSIGAVSLLRTPKPLDIIPLRKVSLSQNSLKTPDARLSVKSPRIATISADTPERSAEFHKNIENISECKLRVLGKGSFGTIVQATYKGELVAVKIVSPQRTNSLNNELNNFLLSHPNIVKTLRIISHDEFNLNGLVIMEIYSSVTLEHLANEDSYTLDERLIVRFMTDVSHALDHCHKQRVLHLDVKPQNVLVNMKTSVCKLCDFGSSCLLSGDDTLMDSSNYKTLHSTVVYTSPELLKGEPPSEKSDVYSFGITLWHLVHKKKPYVVDNKIDLHSTTYKIVKQRKRPHHKIKTNEDLEKLYKNCWEHEPEKRPTMTKVVEFLENLYIF